MTTRTATSGPAVAVGQTIAGKYQVLAVLGKGGMATVYTAWHLALEQRVAVKVLRRQSSDEHQRVTEERFRREARAAARISSEHVCRVTDTGELSDGTPFLVMEYLEGCDLAYELSRRGRVPWSEAIDLVLQACAALTEAHRVGIIHRDIKPANLFLHDTDGGERQLKVLDFGVSKSRGGDAVGDLSLTESTTMVGSPVYMSPEQIWSSRDVDERADVWALGVILFELVCGRRPFQGERIGDLVTAILRKEPPAFAKLGVTVPDGLEAIARRALHKDAAQRFQTPEALAAALCALGSSPRIGSSPDVTTQLALAPTAPALRRRAFPWASWLVAPGLLACTLLISWQSCGPESPPPLPLANAPDRPVSASPLASARAPDPEWEDSPPQSAWSSEPHQQQAPAVPPERLADAVPKSKPARARRRAAAGEHEPSHASSSAEQELGDAGTTLSSFGGRR